MKQTAVPKIDAQKRVELFFISFSGCHVDVVRKLNAKLCLCGLIVLNFKYLI